MNVGAPPRTTIAVPSVDDVARDPTLADGLPYQARRLLILRALTAVAALAAVDGDSADADSKASESDRVLLIDDAAKMLNMTHDYLYRNWAKLGLGYKDADGRVKFSLHKIQRYIRRYIRLRAAR